ncbi:MAG: hypothetical protein AB1Z98_36900 [Nannocystaceae bacterium]
MLFLMLLVVGLGTLSLASPAVAAAPEEAASFIETTAIAKEHRDAGRHAEAAQTFAAAFEALSDQEQRGLKGEITIGNAIDNYRIAQATDPKSLGLLFQEASLLARYGKLTEELPEELHMELERVKTRMQEVHREEEERIAKDRIVEEERKLEERLTAERDKEETAGPVEAPDDVDAETDRPRRLTNIVILSGGLVAVVGGTALVAVGARNIGQVEQRRNELLAELDANDGGTPQMRDALRREIEGWSSRWRGISTGLAVGGGVLAAAGVGFAAWGAVRMRRRALDSGKASVVRPTVSRGWAGVSVGGRF